MVLSPSVSWLIDVHDHHFQCVALALLLCIVASSLIGWTDLHLLMALSFSSLTGIINALFLQICIPFLTADQSKLVTTFRIWRAFNNSGGTIMGTLCSNTKLSYIFINWKYALTSSRKILRTRVAKKFWSWQGPQSLDSLPCCRICLDWCRFLGKGTALAWTQRGTPADTQVASALRRVPWQQRQELGHCSNRLPVDSNH